MMSFKPQQSVSVSWVEQYNEHIVMLKWQEHNVDQATENLQRANSSLDQAKQFVQSSERQLDLAKRNFQEKRGGLNAAQQSVKELQDAAADRITHEEARGAMHREGYSGCY